MILHTNAAAVPHHCGRRAPRQRRFPPRPPPAAPPHRRALPAAPASRQQHARARRRAVAITTHAPILSCLSVLSCPLGSRVRLHTAAAAALSRAAPPPSAAASTHLPPRSHQRQRQRARPPAPHAALPPTPPSSFERAGLATDKALTPARGHPPSRATPQTARHEDTRDSTRRAASSPSQSGWGFLLCRRGAPKGSALFHDRSNVVSWDRP